jgi:hypothetical protein
MNNGCNKTKHLPLALLISMLKATVVARAEDNKYRQVIVEGFQIQNATNTQASKELSGTIRKEFIKTR